MSRQQRKFKDRLFVFIFGKNNEKSKKWRLELYNALNGTHYTDPDALQLNTIENVIYISMHNDVSFLVDNEINLYEQQSTFNPNMPLRGFLYFSQLYNSYLAVNNKNILSSKQIKIPTPKYIVFYNGEKETEDVVKLCLSDAFEKPDNSGDFEWTATLVNINRDRNKSIQKNCKPLYDYSSFVSRTRDNMLSGMPRHEAFEEAVDWAIERDLLEGFFREHRAEVIDMILTEYDEEKNNRTWYEDGVMDGRLDAKTEGAEKLLKEGIAVEIIARCIGLPMEKVLEIQKSLSVNA